MKFQALEWPKILNLISNLAQSLQTREAISSTIAFKKKQEAQEHLKKVVYFMEQYKTAPYVYHLESLENSEIWKTRLKKKQELSVVDFKDLKLFLTETLNLKKILLNFEDSSIKSDFDAQVFNPTEALSAIEQIFSDNGEIRSDASETLYKLFNDKKRFKKEIQKNLDQIVKRHDLETILQDRYVTTREGRWVLPVISGKQHDFGGLIHDSSQSKQTVFMEPQEVIPLNNELKKVDSKIEAEVKKILKDLSQYMSNIIDELEKTEKGLVLFDRFSAFSKFALQTKSNPIEFTKEGQEFELYELKHPLLVLDTGEVIANTLNFNLQERIFILSGPNAGGKTALLKSLGLACHMARCGLPICALENSKVPFFENIHITIGDEQSLDEHLSTFAAHLKKLESATELSGPQSLILVDEICSATEAGEGAALARAFIEKYIENNVYGFITSHLNQLKSHWPKEVVNSCMEYDSITDQPTYKFIKGVAGESFAIQTALRIGLDPVITKRAITHLSPEAQKRFEGLEAIESIQKKLIQDQKSWALKKIELDRMEKKLSTQLTEFENQKQEQLQQIMLEAQKNLNKEFNLVKIKKSLLNQKELDKLKKQMPKIVKAQSQSSSPKKEITAENLSRLYPPGSKVYIKSLKKEALIQSGLDSKNNVSVLSGPMRLSVPLQDIMPPQSHVKTSKKFNQSSKFYDIVGESSSSSLDLRGTTIAEALEKLDSSLDEAQVMGTLRLKIIHGHGTSERLKKSIRTHLSRSLYVKNWRSGQSSGESDGVTIAEL